METTFPSLWWPRWTPVLASFAVVLTAYWLYTLLVVPWIEPSIHLQAEGPWEDLFSDSEHQRQLLENLFPPGAWELDQPKVFESRQSKLLFKDYTKQSPTKVELRPCTLIFLPDDPELPLQEQYRRAVVMEVPEGALLEFDQPLDITQGKMGRLVRGQLQGPVRIRSQGRLPGPEDDLRITTREVRLEQKQITSSEKVECWWGPHFAKGQDLRIQLSPGSQASAGLSLGGLQTVEVRRVELVHIEVPAETTRSISGRPSAAGRSSDKPSPSSKPEKAAAIAEAGRVATPSGACSLGPNGQSRSITAERTSAAPGASASETDAGQESPAAGAAEITCQGPFRFDAKNWEASFSDQVLVRYRTPEGYIDTLRCDRLLVAFKTQPVPSSKKQASGSGPSLGEGSAQPAGQKLSSSTDKQPPGTNQTANHSPQPKPTPNSAAQPTSASVAPAKPPAAEAPKKPSSVARLEPQRLEATGRPVILEAPSRQTRAVAERLEYHLSTGRTILQASQEAWICHGPHEIHAQKLDYTPGPAGQLGQGAAEGAGWLRAETDPRTAHTLQARWSQALQLRPHQSQLLLSLLGEAEVRHPGIGQLAAQQIHLWIREQPTSGPSVGALSLGPDRLLAEGEVQIWHPQLTAKVDRLEIWFEMVGPLRLPAVGAEAPAPQNPNAHLSQAPIDRSAVGLLRYPSYPKALREQRSPNRFLLPVRWVNYSAGCFGQQKLPEPFAKAPPALFPSPALQPTSWSEKRPESAPDSSAGGLVPQTALDSPQALAASAQAPIQQFELRCRLLRALMVLAGPQSELKELIVEGDVFLHQTQTAQPGEKPLVVTGQRIHVVDASRPYLALTVEGQPAHVEARGLALNGPKINLHRGTNRLWIEGPGWMNLPMDRDLQGRLSGQNDQIDVHWQHRMEFDGRCVRLEESVLASSTGWQLRTDSLEVQLREPIVFSAAKMVGNAQLHRLICRSDVLLENRSWDAQGDLSRDQVEVADLTVDLITGDLIASGPGLFRSVRRSPKKAEGQTGTVAESAQTEGRTRLPELIRPDASPTGLVFLSVEFQRSLAGNLHRRELTFTDRVRTIYGPVSDWQQRILWSQLVALPPRVVFLSCDQLQVAELVLPPSGERFLELVAEGNTAIESAGYMARAHRLSYTEHKGLVVLEGDGRTDAELFRQQRIGAPRERVAARKIYYWPQTNHLTLDSASLLELFQPEKKR